MIVELSVEEMTECVLHGRERAENYIYGRRKNMKDGLMNEDIVRFNVDGCMGEVAVAKALRLSWSGRHGAEHYDVGDRLEVRSTRYENGRLIIKDVESDHVQPGTPYVLTVVSGSAVRICGWQTIDYLLQDGEPYEQKGILFLRCTQAELRPFADLAALYET